MSVTDLLEGKRICVCAGAGGVGKTTVSAAVALGMAARGLKVAVVTIDPARRLANALGLRELANEPRQVDLSGLDYAPSLALGPSGSEQAGGELWAMMLDPKRTFDELIERVSPDPRRAEAIKGNRVYRELSSAVSGSQEFTAIAKLYELEQASGFDLLVLDTPPARNALDFLEAPGRLSSFLDGRALKVLHRPTGIGVRVLGRGAAPLLGALRRVTGVDLLSDLSTFFGLLGDMTDDFSEQAHQVERMLRAPTTAFLLVTLPEQEPIAEAAWFRQTLREAGMPFAGVIVNRFHHDFLADAEPGSLGEALECALAGDLPTRVIENLSDYQLLARRDRRNVGRLVGALGDERVVLVPHLDDDVHDLEGLLRVYRYLFASESERERLIAEVVA